jgi:selenide, water dikinase
VKQHPVQSEKKIQLALIGGGHTHVLTLNNLIMSQQLQAQILLITDRPLAPYSGMLPGLIAGDYTYDQAHIDLRRLCHRHGVNLIIDEVMKIEPHRKEISLKRRPAIRYDLASINVGGQTPLDAILDPHERLIAVKPMHQFMDRLISLEKHAIPDQIAIIGAGAAGIEVAFALNDRWHQRSKIHLIHRGQTLLQERGWRAHDMVKLALKQAGIDLHLGRDVVEIKQDSAELSDGTQVLADAVFLVTGVQAPKVITNSTDLPLVDGTFVHIDNFMRVHETKQLYAAGDCAMNPNKRTPRSGVYAVRQAKTLTYNLSVEMRQLIKSHQDHEIFERQKPAKLDTKGCSSKKLKSYHPQKDFLALMRGPLRKTFGFRNGLAWHSKWLWLLKDSIDRKFMSRFIIEPFPTSTVSKRSLRTDELQGIDSSNNKLSELPAPKMRCFGCGSKISADRLEDILWPISQTSSGAMPPDHDDIRPKETNNTKPLISLSDTGSAILSHIGGEPELIQSVDGFRPMDGDPFFFGQILAEHAANDCFSEGVAPNTLMLAAQLSSQSPTVQHTQLSQLIAGIDQQRLVWNAKLLGGHTTHDEFFQASLTVTSVIDQIRQPRPISQGDVVILTKPLGSGLIYAGLNAMEPLVTSASIGVTKDQMILSNYPWLKWMRSFEIKASTDISGFGLLRHLLNLPLQKNQAIALQLEAIPCLSPAMELAKQSFAASMTAANETSSARYIESLDKFTTPWRIILNSPETAGPLAIVCEASKSQEILDCAHNKGFKDAAIIATIIESQGDSHAKRSISLI